MTLQEIQAQALHLSEDERRILIDVLLRSLLPSQKQQVPLQGNLSRLRGIAKRAYSTLSDEAISQDYAEYLTQKYS